MCLREIGVIIICFLFVIYFNRFKVSVVYSIFRICNEVYGLCLKVLNVVNIFCYVYIDFFFIVKVYCGVVNIVDWILKFFIFLLMIKKRRRFELVFNSMYVG